GITLSSFTNSGNLDLLGTELVTSAPNNLAGSSVTYTSGGISIVLSSWTYKNLIINGSGGTFNTPPATSLAVNETLSLLAGTLNQNTMALVVSTYAQSGGTFNGGNANMTVNPTFALSGTA